MWQSFGEDGHDNTAPSCLHALLKCDFATSLQSRNRTAFSFSSFPESEQGHVACSGQCSISKWEAARGGEITARWSLFSSGSNWSRVSSVSHPDLACSRGLEENEGLQLIPTVPTEPLTCQCTTRDYSHISEPRQNQQNCHISAQAKLLTHRTKKNGGCFKPLSLQVVCYTIADK